MEQLSVFKTSTPYRSVLFTGFAFYFMHILQQCQARDLNLPITLVDDKNLSSDCLHEMEFSNLKQTLDYEVLISNELTDLKPAILQNVADTSTDSSLSEALMDDYSSSEKKPNTNDTSSYDYFDENNNSWLVVTGAGLSGAALLTLNSGDDSDPSVPVSASLSPTTVTTTTASVNQIKMIGRGDGLPNLIVSTDQGLSYIKSSSGFSSFNKNEVLSANNVQSLSVGNDFFAISSLGEEVALKQYSITQDGPQSSGSITLSGISSSAEIKAINLFTLSDKFTAGLPSTNMHSILTIKPSDSESSQRYKLESGTDGLVLAQQLPSLIDLSDEYSGQLGTFHESNALMNEKAVTYTNFNDQTWLMSGSENSYASLLLEGIMPASWLSQSGIEYIELPSAMGSDLSSAVELGDNLLVTMQNDSSTSKNLISVNFNKMTTEQVLTSPLMSDLFALDINNDGGVDAAMVYDPNKTELHLFTNQGNDLKHEFTKVENLISMPFDQLTGLDALTVGDVLFFAAALQKGSQTTIVADQLSKAELNAMDMFS